jgi:DNA-binding Lrp family transcriptional regulator
MAFSEEDKISIKFLRQNKQYGAKKFLKEFPKKGWSLGGLKKLIRKIDTTGTAARRPGSGRRRTVRTVDNINDVEALVLSQEDNPQTHRTQRQIARELGISQPSVSNIVKRDLRLKCLKKRKAHELTEANMQARLDRSHSLLRRYPAAMVNFIWFMDEKIFTVAAPSNSQNDRLYAVAGTRKKDIAGARLLRTRPTFTKSVMVSVGVSALGRTAIHFVEPGVKVNGQYYRDVLLMQGLLPEIRLFSDYYTFQQDGAPAHRARETVELLGKETPDFIPPTLWPPNSPDLNPVDYQIWSVMQERVYRTKVRDIEDLRQRIVQVWDDFDQGIIDASVKQWRMRLRACVAANGGQFEHNL